MLDYIITISIFIGLFIVLAISTKRNKTDEEKKNSFLSINNTNALKALSCFFVIIVHIPIEFQNKVQDLIGSFAYIGVTLFFLISAYGCCYGMKKGGKSYLKWFWPKRLVSLLVPALIINFIVFFINGFQGTWDFFSLIEINDYIITLLIMYLFFFIFSLFTKIPLWCRHLFIIFAVIVFSLVTKYSNLDIPSWPAECYGFIWGILIFDFKHKIEMILSKKYFIPLLTSFFGSLILGVLYLKFKHITFFGDYCLKILLGFFLVCFILTLSFCFNFNKRPIQFIGNISYEIYLVHIFVIHFLSDILLKNNIGMQSGIFILIVYVATTIISILVYLPSKYINVKFVDFIKRNQNQNIISK